MAMVIPEYASRIYDEPRITARLEPVLHGPGDGLDNPGPLTRSQLEQFAAQGFLLLPEFFSRATVDACLQEVDALLADEAVQKRPELIREPADNTVRSIFAAHTFSPFFKRLTAEPRIVGITEQVLGSRVYIHQCRINLKLPFRGKEFYWHSDFETWHVEDGLPAMRAVSCSILLTDNTPHNGPQMLIPGSHLHYVSCVGATPEKHYEESLRKQEYGVPDHDSLRWLIEQGGLQAATGPAGTVLLFECNAMHGSNSNITPTPRTNFFCVYNSVKNPLVDPFGNTQPRPEYIAHRDFTPVNAAAAEQADEAL